jgi:hypothetical protein
MVVPSALFEHMHQIIETSELRAIYVPGETARRFKAAREMHFPALPDFPAFANRHSVSPSGAGDGLSRRNLDNS